jgi:hypothetical protein
VAISAQFAQMLLSGNFCWEGYYGIWGKMVAEIVGKGTVCGKETILRGLKRWFLRVDCLRISELNSVFACRCF